jgi:histidine racemase
MKLNHVVIARPGGNDTALVFDPVPIERRKLVNQLIQKQKPEVEQVMFVEEKGSLPCGLMAGGEFCGNATRALGYYCLKGENGRVLVSVSGSQAPLEVEVRDGAASAQMPIYSSFDCIQPLSQSQTIVHMEGISYLVLGQDEARGREICDAPSLDEQKGLARVLLNNPAFSNCAAMGVIVMTEDQGCCAIKPFVYVRSIDTFYFETACGSGSVAVGLVEAWQQKKNLRAFALRQPSGMTINVDVELNGDRFGRASISGPVSIEYEGPLGLGEEKIAVREIA